MPQRLATSPVRSPSAPASVARVTVRSGDSLSSIARANGVSTQALVAANADRYPGLASNPNALQVGWSLVLPARGALVSVPTSPAAPRSNDDILHVGMNKDSTYEVDVLKRRGNSVIHVGDTAANDRITTGDGVSHDLDTEEGRMAFAMTLRLPVAQSQAVAAAIGTAGPDAKDELAQIAQVWARAENGGPMPSRLVLSGHNVGSGVWGDDNGKLTFEALGALAEAMPRAARRVEDLHLAACYSGGQAAMEMYRGMFPNAKTIWAYTGSAPGVYSGAEAHLRRWDTATRGDKATLDRTVAEGTRKGENIAVWSAQHGYVDGKPPVPLEDVRSAHDAQRGALVEHLSGAQAVENPQTGPLREFYNQTQRLLQHADLPPAERPALEKERDQTIRLLYFTKTIAPRFQSTHGEKVRAGFEAAGLPVPDFSKLSRAEALASIAAFEQAASGLNPQPRAVQTLLPMLTEGLRDLSAARIPESWI